MKLDKESSVLTTFETSFSRYRWLRLPFGNSPSPKIFQAKMHETLNGLKGVACIADDILIFGCGETKDEADTDHDRNIIVLLNRCQEKGLHLNKEKLQLRHKSTIFRGRELTSEGLRRTVVKCRQLKKCRRQQTSQVS